MSVNEVKLKRAKDPFVVRGSGPASSRTFCIGDEDHTLGNAVRHVLMQNSAVGFAGYSVPHPSEPVVQIRVQTVAPPAQPEESSSSSSRQDPPAAVNALKAACQTLYDQCDVVLETLEELLPEVREDRIRMDKIRLEEAAYYNQGEEDEGDEDDIMDEG